MRKMKRSSSRVGEELACSIQLGMDLDPDRELPFLCIWSQISVLARCLKSFLLLFALLEFVFEMLPQWVILHMSCEGKLLLKLSEDARGGGFVNTESM